jgi:hypothetical protein
MMRKVSFGAAPRDRNTLHRNNLRSQRRNGVADVEAFGKHPRLPVGILIGSDWQW